MRKKKPQKTYCKDNLDEAYKDLMPGLIKYAVGHLYQRDEAVDIAHTVFTRALAHIRRNPKHNISPYLLFKQVHIECRKSNRRTSVEVTGKFNGTEVEREVNERFNQH